MMPVYVLWRPASFPLVDFCSDVCIIKLYQVQVGGVYDDLRISK